MSIEKSQNKTDSEVIDSKFLTKNFETPEKVTAKIKGISKKVEFLQKDSKINKLEREPKTPEEIISDLKKMYESLEKNKIKEIILSPKEIWEYKKYIRKINDDHWYYREIKYLTGWSSWTTVDPKTWTEEQKKDFEYYKTECSKILNILRYVYEPEDEFHNQTIPKAYNYWFDKRMD